MQQTGQGEMNDGRLLTNPPSCFYCAFTDSCYAL